VNEGAKPKVGTGLRGDYLSGLENVAQGLGALAPAGTIGILIPILIGKTGNASWLLLLVTLSAVVLVALNINVFATRFSSAGALSAFARLGLGRRGGITAGWTYIVALTVGAACAVACGAYYLGVAVADAFKAPPSHWLVAALGTLIAAAAWWTAHRDIKLSSRVMLAVELCSMLIMFGVVLLAMAKTSLWVDRPQLRLEGATPSGFALGFAFSFVMLAGFESVATLGEESRDPRRTIPRAILLCVIPTGLVFIVMTYALVDLGHRFAIALDQEGAPFENLSKAVGLPWFGPLTSVGIALSFFACTLGCLNAGARALFYLARDGHAPAGLGFAHPVNATPHRALAVLALVCIAAGAGPIALGISAVDCGDYTGVVAGLGYIASYALVCLAAPPFLWRLRALQIRHVATAVGALIVVGIVFVLTIYPVPPAPWRYLPYCFLALVAAGWVVTLLCRDAGRPGPPGKAEG
jgi:amino acid transporter